MYLHQLACQYEEAAGRIQKRIAELKKAAEQAYGQEAASLQKRIETLYTELHDLRVVAKHLDGYCSADAKEPS